MLEVLAPVLQVYVLTPLALMVELNPIHTEALELLMVMVGLGNRPTVLVAVFTQPTALAPITE